MISLSAPKSLKIGDVALSVGVALAVLLLPSDNCLRGNEVDWTMGLILFPVTLAAGLCSAWLYYRRHEITSIDPFSIRAWWSLISGLVALPVCLVFRPSVAPFAFAMLMFGAGPVAGFHIWCRITGCKRARPGQRSAPPP